MNKPPHVSMKPRKRIALAELHVLVSLLVKCWHNNHGGSFSAICKPTWWPSNIRFTYPIQRTQNISPAMWRKDLVTIITNYYYTTRNSREHLNGRNVLNNSEFLWEIQGQLFDNNNDSATVMKPNRSNRENSVQLSENTLKRLMPRLEVRLVDILATDKYRKFRRNSEQSRQKEFLRGLSLITVPECDNMSLDTRYRFCASTKEQSEGQQSLPMLQMQEADEATISAIEEQNADQLAQEANHQERNNNEQQTSVNEEIITIDIEPIVVDTTVAKNCLQEKQVDSSEKKQLSRDCTTLMEKADSSQSSNKASIDLDDLSLKERLSLLESSVQEQQVEFSCDDKQSLWESTVLVAKANSSRSSSKATIDLDELSLKARASLQQCSPSYATLNTSKTSNERRRRKKLKKRRIKQRVLQPRRARMISRLKISSSYIKNWTKAVKCLS